MAPNYESKKKKTQPNQHLTRRQKSTAPPFLQTPNQLICDLAVPSLTHQWFLLSFATEVVKTPLALSSHVSPNRHVHLTSALLPPPPLTTCYSLFPQRCEVCCLIILVSDLSRVRMHVRCIHESSCSCDTRCHGGLVINSAHFILQEFYHFGSYFRLFCSLLGRSSKLSKLSHPSPLLRSP